MAFAVDPPPPPPAPAPVLRTRLALLAWVLVWPPLAAMMLAAPPAWMPLVLGGVAAAGLGLHRGRTWGLVALAGIAAALALHASGLLAPVGVTWHVAGPPTGALLPPEGADELVAWRAALFAGSAALACALAVAPYAGPAWRWLRGAA